MTTEGNMDKDRHGELFATIGTWVVAGFLLVIVALVLLKLLAMIAGALF